MSGRRIFVGDLQGCLDPLRRLLDALAFAPPGDALFCAGDLVNKGPQNAATLRFLRGLGATCVLGNHDVHLLEAAAGRRAERPGDTFRDVLAAHDRESLLDWLEQRPLLVHLGDVVMVHAAVRPGWGDLRMTAPFLRERFESLRAAGRSPFEDEDVRFALSARYCSAEGEQIVADDQPPRDPRYRNWADWWSGPETIVFGHFAVQGLLVRPHLRGLDSGCVYGRHLTAWIAEEDRIESVDC